MCEARQARFVEFLSKLPERPVNASIRADLPESTLGAVPGSAPVIEITAGALVIDGQPVRSTALPERIEAVRAWSAAHALGPAGKAVVYVAAAHETDVRTLRAFLAALPESFDPRLLVRTLPSPATVPTRARHSAPQGEGDATPGAAALAERLLSERDPKARRALAEQGYRNYSRCPDLAAAVESVSALDPQSRWPALRSRMTEAVPRCRCSDLDTPSLERLLSAEHRAGASTLGVLPLAFLRDVRCGASMPLRSIGKLVRQMEDFDREFAGQFAGDAVQFDDVLGSERLLGYFCGALPGETLAAEQRQRATVYFRRSAGGSCEGWRFEPLSPGAPMGTFRRISPSGNPLAVHYWQAAEELRLFGPVPEPATKPTDPGTWACDGNQRLRSVDARSIELENGRWFFDEAACRDAALDVARPMTGCFATLGEQAAPAEEKAAPERR